MADLAPESSDQKGLEMAAPRDQGSVAQANLTKEQPMQISHTDVLAAIPEFNELVTVIQRHFSLSPEEAVTRQATFERELREHTLRLERGVHARDFERMDVDVQGIVVDGARYARRSGKTTGHYMTLAGKIEVPRSTYRRRGGHGGETVAALDLRLGLLEGHWTPTAAEVATTFMASCPSAEAASLLKTAGTMSPSSSHLDRVTKLVGDRWEARRVEFEAEVRAAESLDLPSPSQVSHLVLSLDGIMVPMKDAPRTPGQGKKDQGPKGHKEAACGTVTLQGAKGERLRTIRFGRMPESHKRVLHQQLADELRVLVARYPNAAVVAVADGAHENWRIIEAISEELGCQITQRLDYFHAAQHVVEGLRAADAGDEAIDAWCSRLKGEAGVIEPLISELGFLSMETGRRAVEQSLNYFLNNAHRVDYAEAAQLKQPIGSGVQEAACKTLVAQRMKRSGMSWRNRGGQAVLTLRGLAQSDRLGHAWDALRPTLPTHFQVDTERKRKRPARAAS